MSIYMIFSILLLCTMRLNALSQGMKQALQQVHDGCVKRTGVEMKYVNACWEGKFTEDHKLKSYIKCMLMKFPLFNAEEDIDVDFIVDVIPEDYKDMFEPIAHSCGTVKGENMCETGLLTRKCWFAKISELSNLD